MNRRRRELDRTLGALGFTYWRKAGSGHLIYRHEPSGKLLVMASTTGSRHRAARGMIARARRISKGLE